MKLDITKAEFKGIVNAQLGVLRTRGVVLKSSDVLESLSVGLGFANFATLNAKFKSIARRRVDSAKYLAATNNLFVITWECGMDENGLDESLAVFPPGTKLSDFQSRNYAAVDTVNESFRFMPKGFAFSSMTVALENWAIVPNVSRYGLPDSAHSGTATRFFEEWTNFRLPESGVEVDFNDTGDDTSGKERLLVWLTDEDAAIVRAMFAES